jgi:hypothetical protein
LCILVALLRSRRGVEADHEPPMPGKVALWIVLGLAFLGLHLLLGNWLWQASASGEILSCGENGCLKTLVSLEGDAWGFWLSAGLYWIACIIAPLVYLYPLACWLRQAWRSRRAHREAFADTEPAEPHW